MRNSLLVIHPCKHFGCSKMPKFGCGGFCEDHKTEDPGVARKKARLVRGKPIKIPVHTPTLRQFYGQAAIDIDRDPHCWNCGAFISLQSYHAATAHILPKEHFPSVQSHPLNFLVLGVNCCHDQSHRLDKFSKMKVFPLAVERFRVFEPLITERHKLLDEFRKYANLI